MGTGHQLRSQLNTLNDPTIRFGGASNLGVELVDHFDSHHHPIFHTADGDVVFRDHSTGLWQVVEGARSGVPVRSGNFERIHAAYTHPAAVVADTALIDDTATVEAGARIGPHSVIGPHAHIGRGTIIASYSHVEAGGFVGAYSTIQAGSRVGDGAIVGAGSRIGHTANIGPGSRLAQGTEISTFSNVPAQSEVSATPSRSLFGGNRPGQITHLIDRLAQLDRE